MTIFISRVRFQRNGTRVEFSPSKRNRSSLFLVIVAMFTAYAWNPEYIIPLAAAQSRAGVAAPIKCYQCIWYPNSQLPSTMNVSEICRSSPMAELTTCPLGCVTTAIYMDADTHARFLLEMGKEVASMPRDPRVWGRTRGGTGTKIISNSTLPTALFKKSKNATYPVNISLPDVTWFSRGCAHLQHKGCIMDISRPGVFHEDCYCSENRCNGIALSDGMSTLVRLGWFIRCTIICSMVFFWILFFFFLRQYCH